MSELERSWAERLGDAGDGAKAGAAFGATVGSIVPGVGTAIGGAAGAVVGGIVGLARGLTGQPHARAEAPALTQAAEAVAGVADAAQALAVLQADPVKAEEFRVQALGIRAEAQQARDAHILAVIQADAEDRAGARAHTATLAATGSKLAWGAAVVTVVILGLFGYAIVLSPDITPDMKETLKVLTVAASSYWLGSSAGSANKDRRIEKIEQR